jgi:hypothetical protein
MPSAAPDRLRLPGRHQQVGLNRRGTPGPAKSCTCRARVTEGKVMSRLSRNLPRFKQGEILPIYSIVSQGPGSFQVFLLRTWLQAAPRAYYPDRESQTIMSFSRAQRLETPLQRRCLILFMGILLSYISLIGILFIMKKHEFIPFEGVRDNYLQINPFDGQIIKAPEQSLHGKGVVVRVNSMCNSLVEQSPEFNYLVFSQNILGNLCAKDPSQVNFVAYIKYEKHIMNQPQNSKKLIYQLAKKVAVINWPNKELVAQKTFTKNYTFSKSYTGKDSDAERKLCLITEEPSDEEVRGWITSLALSDPS